MHKNIKKTNINKIAFNTGTNVLNIFNRLKSLTVLLNLFLTGRFETKRRNRPNWQVQNKTLQIIRTVKTQQSS